MRLTHLILARYGHLADVTLDFPTERGLHVVLGANEAGKSTALAAIGDVLFGFPHRTEFAFRHEARALRVGIGLRADDGRQATFFRRKGRKDDLCDAADQALPESAIAAYLGGVTRERFFSVFGLDGAELRRGGAAILEGKGEAGESILQAHTGLSGFRALADRLAEEAGRLAGDRRGRRALHAALDAFKAAKADLDRRAVEPDAYRHAAEEHAGLLAARAAGAREAAVLHAERSRLARIRATAPARAAIARAAAARAALGPVPAVPADAEAQLQAAVAQRERAAHDLVRERDRAGALDAALAALEVDDALLAGGDAIDTLAADRNRIAAAERDREKQRIVAAQHRAAVEQATRRLGLDGDAASVAARVPNALKRDAASRMISAHERLAARQAQALEGAQAARAEAAEAAERLARLPEAAPAQALRAAIEPAKAEGRLDADRAQAEQAVAAAREALQAALAAVPLWAGTAEALARLPLPLDAALAAATQALADAAAALEGATAAVAAHDRALAEIAADLRGSREAATLASPEAIAAARARRDRAWALIRRHHLEGGPPPSSEERAGLGADASLPAAFEALLRAADALADRRAEDATEVARHAALRGRQAREAALRKTALAAEAAARAAAGAAAAQWATLWAPAGLVPLDPPAMREWRARRDDVLAKLAALRTAERALAAVAARHEAAWAALAPLLTDEATAADGRLAALLAAAERVCGERERQQAALAEAQRRVAEAQGRADQQARGLAALAEEEAAWRAGWVAAAHGLGLPPGASPEAGKLALELWSAVERAIQAWNARNARIAEMTHDIDAFGAATAALTRRIAPDLAAVAPQEAAHALANRLAGARAAAARRQVLRAEQGQVQAAIAAREAERDAAGRTLAVLRGLARVEDDNALQAAIARAATDAELRRQIDERGAELARLDDGKTMAELEAEAAGVDLDALPARLEAVDARLKALADEGAGQAARLATLAATLQEMEAGRDAAGAAQAMHDARSEMDEIVVRYTRLRLAQTLLRAGIDRFRRQQQAPLLAEAGRLFARLTEGRYDGLFVDETEAGTPLLLARAADGTHCPAERLSDGTRDQLYLALRLAALTGAAGGERMPFIADDLLVNFDDRRARAALNVLAEFAASSQTILFTHHAHIAAMAEPEAASLHRLAAAPAEAAA
ncbi:MAG: AAA family ATPase [Alphaproteobacteria bacterium]|nr:AAA family ATPase [Alphaproteobacteria bacterium]